MVRVLAQQKTERRVRKLAQLVDPLDALRRIVLALCLQSLLVPSIPKILADEGGCVRRVGVRWVWREHLELLDDVGDETSRQDGGDLQSDWHNGMSEPRYDSISPNPMFSADLDVPHEVQFLAQRLNEALEGWEEYEEAPSVPPSVGRQLTVLRCAIVEPPGERRCQAYGRGCSE